MKVPKLLDLFCGAGGAGTGYADAGFEVIGVDIKPQPNYPFRFVQFDAMEALDILAAGGTFDWIGPGIIAAYHASPPCQAYIRSGMVAKDGRHPDLVGPTRTKLEKIAAEWGTPWVIENVPGAPMRGDIMLCGSMFGLKVRRHRYFETSWRHHEWSPPCDHSQPITGVYGHPHGKGGAWRNGSRPMLPSDLPTWSDAMGIDWMNATELAAAIPPAYTKYIGSRLLTQVREGVA